MFNTNLLNILLSGDGFPAFPSNLTSGPVESDQNILLDKKEFYLLQMEVQNIGELTAFYMEKYSVDSEKTVKQSGSALSQSTYMTLLKIFSDYTSIRHELRDPTIEESMLRWIRDDLITLQNELRDWLAAVRDEELRAKQLKQYFAENGIDLEKAERQAKKSQKKHKKQKDKKAKQAKMKKKIAAQNLNLNLRIAGSDKANEILRRADSRVYCEPDSNLPKVEELSDEDIEEAGGSNDSSSSSSSGTPEGI